MTTTTQEFTAEQINNNNKIIDVMVSQMGGRRFMVMTGSTPQYKQVKTNNPLIAFKLKRNSSKANYLKVYYISGADTYKMEFVRATKNVFETVESYEGVYGDMLESIFTKVTGLYTSL